MKKYDFDQSLGYLTGRLNARIYKDFREKLGEHGVTLGEWSVLINCYNGHDSLSSIAEILGVDLAAIKRMIDSLEEKKLIERTLCGHDSRFKTLLLTSLSLELIPKLIKQAESVNQKYLSCLNLNERELLLGLLRKVSC